jgi:hypothetical protein
VNVVEIGLSDDSISDDVIVCGSVRSLLLVKSSPALVDVLQATPLDRFSCRWV